MAEGADCDAKIILSAKHSVDDRVGCRAGGTILKPFSFSELLARVQALIRRHPTSEPEELFPICH